MKAYCPKCRENSVSRKIYTTKEGQTKRVEYCIIKGCGYNQQLPILNEVCYDYPALQITGKT